MTVTVAERLDAGINDSRFAEARSPARSVVVPDFVPEQWARTRSTHTAPPAEKLDAEVRRLRQGPGAADRARKLRVLLAKLEGLSFRESAELLDQRPTRLADMVHGRIPVPSSLERRIDELAEIVFNVHEVLEPAAFRDWLHVEAPQLRGGSPIEAIRRGRLRDVAVLARSYGQSSYV